MKKLLSFLIIAAAAMQSLFAQTTTLTFTQPGTQTVQVPAGQVFQMLSFHSTASVASAPSTTVNGVFAYQAGSGFTAAGPAAVSITNNNGVLVCTYKLYVDSQSATANVASQAVVIPSNATANADIIFESSPDLITWTAAVAGSYAPTTPNRFFRVRLVTH